MADTKVRDVMTNLVKVREAEVNPKDSIHEAAQRLAKNGISGAPVVEAGKVVGIVLKAPTRSRRDAASSGEPWRLGPRPIGPHLGDRT